jgi:hypothetical protein
MLWITWALIYSGIGFGVWLLYQFTDRRLRQQIIFLIAGIIILFAAGGMLYELITTGSIGAPTDGR